MVCYNSEQTYQTDFATSSILICLTHQTSNQGEKIQHYNNNKNCFNDCIIFFINAVSDIKVMKQETQK